MRVLNEEAMAAKRDRLLFRFFRIVEGEAEGRFAISALVALVLAALTVSLILKGVVPLFLDRERDWERCGPSLNRVGRFGAIVPSKE
jgi:hypothetical protein